MKNNTEFKYRAFSKKFNLSDWIIGDTQPHKDVVVLFLQGGPGVDLYFDYNIKIKDIKDNKEMDKGSKESLINYLTFTRNFKENLMQEYQVVQVKQTQNVKKDLAQTKKHISVETSIKEQKENIQILDKVIKSYKKQKKKVIVIGHSVGGYIINNYLSTYKPKADLFVVGNSRLDVPLAFPTFIDQENIIPFFNKEGKFFDKENEFKYLSMRESMYKRVGLSLVYTRFTKKLKNKSLKKVIYVTCHEDMWLSSLNLEEKEFIKKRGGKIIESTSLDKNKLNKLSFKNDFGATAHTTVFLEPIVKIIKKEIEKL